MRVLLMPCGIGMGHASRCLTIARKLHEDGAEVAFASYGCGYEILDSYHEYQTLKLPDIKFYGANGELDIKYTAKKSINIPYIFLKSIFHESRIIRKFKPDIILADSHFSVPITAKLHGIPCVMIQNELTLNFSDIYPQEKKIEYLENGLKKFIRHICNLSKIIMIPDVPGSTEIPLKLNNKVIHTGPFLKNNPVNMPSKEDLRRKLGFNNSDKIVLVTVGGSNFGIELLKLICDSSSMINCDRLIIVTGPEIEADFINETQHIIKKKFLENMMEWMKISDVIVTLAGHTTIMEAISLGIPNMIIPIDNHPEQLKNAVNIEKYGISIVDDLKNMGPDEISANINRLLSDPEIIELADKVKDVFSKYNGIEIAVEIIKEHARDNQPLQNY
ncbi:MAG: UDP-N-acetylglucosamine--N-acetylmuramyl-(pentapeptide) pyrophosphoryl-undecaprenol N-acetylglucosamine transferase [Methanobacterium sp.]